MGSGWTGSDSSAGISQPGSHPVAANVLAPARYATELYKLGFTDVHVRVQVDVHELAATAEVVEWTRGSTLTRFTSVLPNDVHDEFIDAYRRAVIAELGEERPYRYTFERILAVGRRSTT